MPTTDSAIGLSFKVDDKTITVDQKLLDRYLLDIDDFVRPDVIVEFNEKIVDPLEVVISKFGRIDYGEWIEKLIGFFRKVKKTNFKDQRIKQYVKKYYKRIKNSLKIFSRGTPAKTIIYAMQKSGTMFPIVKYDLIETQFISLDEIVSRLPNGKLTDDGKVKWLEFSCEHGSMRIPLSKEIFHKGGAARVILKLLFGNGKYLASEFPLKDLDILVQNVDDGLKFFDLVGEKDKSGIEAFNGDIDDIMCSRDIDLNQAILVGIEGLYYTQAAKRAAETGIIHAGEGDHGIYGTDSFIIVDDEGIHYNIIKGRSSTRCIKAVIEDKAEAFEMRVMNLQFSVGCAAFIEAIRKIDKPNYPERLAKFYHIIKKMGQFDIFKFILENKYGLPCNNLFDLMEGLHIIYSQIGLQMGDDEGIAQWLMRKFNIWFKSNFRRQHNLPNIVYETRNYGIVIDKDEETVLIDMKDYVQDDQFIAEIRDWLPGFKERCRIRKEHYDDTH